jgi:hypothetical protein
MLCMGWQRGETIEDTDCWLKHDFCMHDNTALMKAVKHGPVLPL